MVHLSSVMYSRCLAAYTRRLKLAFEHMKKTSQCRQSLKLMLSKCGSRCELGMVRRAWSCWVDALKQVKLAGLALKSATAVGRTAMRFLSYRVSIQSLVTLYLETLCSHLFIHSHTVGCCVAHLGCRDFPQSQPGVFSEAVRLQKVFRAHGV